MVSWMHPEKKAVSRLNSDALVTQLPSNSLPFLGKVLAINIGGQRCPPYNYVSLLFEPRMALAREMPICGYNSWIS